MSVRRMILALSFCAVAAELAAQAGGANANIVGRVIDTTDGRPIDGARIDITRAGAMLISVTSDDDGRFSVPALEPGTFRLAVSAAGYFDLDEALVLKPRDALRVNVELVARTGVQESVVVHDTTPAIDPQRTGSSIHLTSKMLDDEASPITVDVPTLAENTLPGAVLGHDNFIHVRGNELSLHQFINGVSFLDNPHQHFFPGLSPGIFESVNMVTGGFRAEYGNRFGGILDITTRSGASMGGRGRASIATGTVNNQYGSAEYGGSEGRFGYYVYGGAFQSDRFLNPPEREELHDNGRGARGVVQLDYQRDDDFFKVLVSGGGSRFELPNTIEEHELDRNAKREVDAQSVIVSWQRVISSRTLFSVSGYERDVSDRVLPTTDPVTSFADASRDTLTLGVKTDWYHTSGIHQWKAGADFAHLRLRESFDFDSREEAEEGHHGSARAASIAGVSTLLASSLSSFSSQSSSTSGDIDEVRFSGRDESSVFGVYLQDRLSPIANLTIDLGLRFDRIDIVDSDEAVSPRVGAAYHFPGSGSVIRASYNRLFTPPPIEYVLLASFFGGHAEDEAARVGPAKAYRQNFFEAGWSQEIRRGLQLDIGVYRHTGVNAFENSEIASSRVFVPTNFGGASARGLEIGLQLAPSGNTGFTGYVRYALAKVRFEGPVTGGLAGEELAPGETIPPAFDQRHTLVGSATYRNTWRRLALGAVVRYGSGTPTEAEADQHDHGGGSGGFVYLPDHTNVDIRALIGLWGQDAHQLDFELNVTNLTDNVFAIAKESEFTPIQYSPRRRIIGQLRFAF